EDAVGLDVAGEQGILDLQVGDRGDRGRSPNRRRPHLTEPDVSDVPLLDELRDGSHRFLNGDVGIEARRAVDVDVVDAEPAQRVGQRVLDVVGVDIEPRRHPFGSQLRAELHREHDVVAAATLYRLANEQLVVAGPVEVGGVDQCAAGVEIGPDYSDAFGGVGGPVGAGQAHAAETGRRGGPPHLAAYA